jgi:aerobic carbon-monoxide dehydrogenase medium subunit
LQRNSVTHWKTFFMKSPPFSYLKAQSLPHLFSVMAQYGDELRILAGGQTLLASLNMRLSEPQLLIDIRGLAELNGISVDNHVLRIGALVTHSEIESSALVAQHAPMLAQAAPHIAHRAIRNLGTLGGSIAYADPAAEWPVCALALNATIVLQSANSQRKVVADEFFQGLYSTAMQDDEIIVACEFPIIQPGQAHDFSELARRHGDYAVAGLALSGGPGHYRIAFLGIAERPIRALAAETIVNQSTLNEMVIDAAVTSLTNELEPLADLTHSAQSKLHLAGVLLKRALKRVASPHILGKAA